jgi:hypothetical protein
VSSYVYFLRLESSWFTGSSALESDGIPKLFGIVKVVVEFVPPGHRSQAYDTLHRKALCLLVAQDITVTRIDDSHG